MQGFLFPSPEKAQTYFDRAAGCFEKALAEEPKNEVYKKALEMTTKARDKEWVMKMIAKKDPVKFSRMN